MYKILCAPRKKAVSAIATYSQSTQSNLNNGYGSGNSHFGLALYLTSVCLAIVQLVKAQTLSENAGMFIHACPCRRSEVSTPETNSQNSGFHRTEIGK